MILREEHISKKEFLAHLELCFSEGTLFKFSSFEYGPDYLTQFGVSVMYKDEIRLPNPDATDIWRENLKAWLIEKEKEYAEKERESSVAVLDPFGDEASQDRYKKALEPIDESFIQTGWRRSLPPYKRETK